MWDLVGGFRGYAFCRAHSTAYGVEAYQGAYLKHYHPAEFLASVLSNGKGFYSTLAYTLECRRLGLTFLSPDVNASRWNFAPEDGQPHAIRVPLRFIKSITAALLERYQIERARAPFDSLRDFHERTRPTGAEMLNLIRSGAFDGFGEPRTAQFWHLQHIAQWPHAQGYLFQNDERVRLPEVPLTEPDQAQRLRDETELLSFTVSGHPLEQFPDVAWDTYCPIRELARYPGEIVHVCGPHHRRSLAPSSHWRRHEVHHDLRLHRHHRMRNLRPNLPPFRPRNRPPPRRGSRSPASLLLITAPDARSTCSA